MSSLLLLMAKRLSGEYGYSLMMTDFSLPKKPKHSRHCVRIPYYSRVWDKRVEIYGTKRRNTTRR